MPIRKVEVHRVIELYCGDWLSAIRANGEEIIESDVYFILCFALIHIQLHFLLRSRNAVACFPRGVFFTPQIPISPGRRWDV